MTSVLGMSLTDRLLLTLELHVLRERETQELTDDIVLFVVRPLGEQHNIRSDRLLNCHLELYASDPTHTFFDLEFAHLFLLRSGLLVRIAIALRSVRDTELIRFGFEQLLLLRKNGRERDRKSTRLNSSHV